MLPDGVGENQKVEDRLSPSISAGAVLGVLGFQLQPQRDLSAELDQRSWFATGVVRDLCGGILGELQGQAAEADRIVLLAGVELLATSAWKVSQMVLSIDRSASARRAEAAN
jgi:hypothetical protein